MLLRFFWSIIRDRSRFLLVRWWLVKWTGIKMPTLITGSSGADSYLLYGPEGQRIAKETAGGQLFVYLNEVHELVLNAENRATSRLTLPLGKHRGRGPCQ